jgi:hypothetical protein
MIRYEDLRNAPAHAVAARLSGLDSNAGAYVTAWQLAALPRTAWRDRQSKLIVTVPDFLNYARLLNTGQAKAVALLPGSFSTSAVSAALAGIGSMKNIPRLAQMDFWAVAESLLRYDLALVSRGFRGTICLHSHLTDFASVFEREDFLRTFFRLVRKRGSAGIHTQQLPVALSCLSRWRLVPETVSFLCASGDVDGTNALRAAKQSAMLGQIRLLAEMDSWPPDLQNAQCAERTCGVAPEGFLVSTS